MLETDNCFGVFFVLLQVTDAQLWMIFVITGFCIQ